jgi:hypothetical protein
MSEKPSLDRVFNVFNVFQEELEDLRSQNWDALDVRHLGMWWRRIPLLRKFDWAIAIPGITAALVFLGVLLYAIFQQHWLFGTAVVYALFVAGYIVWRHGE